MKNFIIICLAAVILFDNWPKLFHKEPKPIIPNENTLEVSRDGKVVTVHYPSGGSLHLIQDSDEKLVDIQFFNFTGGAMHLVPDTGKG